MIIIIYGNIGGGKTTIAKALADKLDFDLIHFDPLVQAVTGKENMYGNDGSFLLSDEEIEQVHYAMRDKARNCIILGRNIILESMFFKKQREEAIEFAEEMNIPFKLIEVVCDEEEAINRIKNRLDKNSQSAGISLFLENKDQLKDEKRKHIVIDTTNKSIKDCVKEITYIIGL